MRHAFLRSCSTDRHSSIAGRDRRRAKREQIGAGVGAAAKPQPGALGLRKAAQQVRRAQRRRSRCRRLRRLRRTRRPSRVEQRMIGGGDQQRPFAVAFAWISSSMVSAIVPWDARTEMRGSSGKHGRDPVRFLGRGPGSSRSCSLSSSARTGRRTIGSPPTGISALRSVPNCSANASRPGREPASTTAVQLMLRARRRSFRRARRVRSPARGAPHGKSGWRASTRRRARGPRSGRRNSRAPTRITMFGLRRAVISRNLLSIGRQTWISMLQPLDEHAFDDPLRDIAADDRQQHHRREHGLERASVVGEPVQPRPVPEGRVDEVDAVVEHLAPFRRGAGHARELPVDRVEHHEDEARQHAPPIFAPPEEEEGEDAQDRADQGDEIGCDSGPRRPARQIESRLSPEVERQDIGDALVRGIIGGALDRLGIRRDRAAARTAARVSSARHN